MSKISKIEISFPAPVDFPDGFEQALDALVGMVCKQWERENPTMVMWPAGYGSKMLSNPLAMSDDEPLEFDDSVYAISVAAREDYYGGNPHNPERERLRAEAAAERAARKQCSVTPGAKRPKVRLSDWLAANEKETENMRNELQKKGLLEIAAYLKRFPGVDLFVLSQAERGELSDLLEQAERNERELEANKQMLKECVKAHSTIYPQYDRDQIFKRAAELLAANA